MKHPKVIVMDLGGTIIDTVKVDFEKGLKTLYDKYTLKQVSYEEVLNQFNLIINESFKKRSNDDFEINFKNCLNYIDKVVGLIDNVDYEKLEYEFVDISMKRQLVDDVLLFLENVKRKNIPLFILSNSCFSTNELKHELCKFKINDYFVEVFSSADYLMRKPNKIIFDLVINYLKRNKYIKNPSEVWYIGNDYNIDMVGSNNASITGVWLNRLQNKNRENLNIISVNSYKTLIKILEECDDKI